MTPTWHEKAEVIVIGSGLAGLSAAIEARQAGAGVLVLEKMSITGGNTRISDGGLAAPRNYLQERQGIEDSVQLFAEDMLRAGLGLGQSELVYIIAQQASQAIDWTRDDLNVPYLDRLDRFGGHTVARCLTTLNHIGADLIKAQESRLNELGVEIRKRCRLTQLLTDENGAVSGVQVQAGYKFPDEASGERQNIRAERGVVLATGGFANDVRFRALHQPRLDDSFYSTNHRGGSAEGLISALNIGALPLHLSWIQILPCGCADEKGYGTGARFGSYVIFPMGILVDPASGKRILNEWADRRVRADAMINTGHPCLGIVDDEGAQVDAESLRRGLKSGKIRAFDDLAGLAKAYNVPVDSLVQTINDYNQAVDAGQSDAFGKDLSQATTRIARPPFYGIRLWPKVHYTPGGVGINKQAQVLDLHGSPIQRLYAAGEVTGGIHGATRLGSCALTDCVVFGRIAGQQAAVQPPRSS